MLILYLSGLVFFLIQAVVYARLSGPRVLGAVVWPLAALGLPSIISAIRQGRDELGGRSRVLALRWSCIYFGDEPEDLMWGIGA